MTFAFLFFLLIQDPSPDRLVLQLGDEDLEVREKAQEALLKLGDKAVPHLEKALGHADPEVRARARHVISRIQVIAFWDEKLLSGRTADKKKSLAGGGGGEDTEAAVSAALGWLARHQSPDGSWKVIGYDAPFKEKCGSNPGNEDYEPGVSGLALLAFLGAGHTHLSKEYGGVVRKGLERVIARQDRDGALTSREVQKYMYGHGIGALALAEAYAMTRADFLHAPARKAAEFTMAAQNPGKAWRYSYKCGDNDTSVTFWNAFSLCPVRDFGVKESVVDGLRAWLSEVTEDSYGRVGYTHKGTGKVFIPGQNEQYDHHESLTAIGILLRLFFDRKKMDPLMSNGVQLLMRDKPRWDGTLVDFYYWHLGTLAFFQYDGPAGAKWRSWNDELKAALLKNQQTAGCRAGSWEPVDRWSSEGGRVYATALNALTLETYYRYRLVARD